MTTRANYAVLNRAVGILPASMQPHPSKGSGEGQEWLLDTHGFYSRQPLWRIQGSISHKAAPLVKVYLRNYRRFISFLKPNSWVVVS